MEIVELTGFYHAIREDNRVTTTHISVYMALFQCWNEKGFQNPVGITRQRIMERAKISGLATYHKAVKDLHDFGYIQYCPSRNPAVMSVVSLTRFKGNSFFHRM